MRYAIFSDVHANLEAFTALLDFYKNQLAERFIFLGDVVGYGASPRECLDILNSLNPVCVAGNHDWAVVDKFRLNYFNPDALKAIIWTKQILNDQEKQYLGAMPVLHEESDFILTHASLDNPIEFNYVKNAADASANFALFKQNILFVGHTHYQWVCELSGDLITENNNENVDLSPQAKYIVNPGSVGQPRDGDWRAPACIYDSDAHKVVFYRLAYDVETAAKKIIDSGLPSNLAMRLFKGE